MNRQDLLQLIHESRKLLPTANREQKLKLLKLISEGYKKLKASEVAVVHENAQRDSLDYLPEK